MAENVTQLFHWFIEPKKQEPTSYDIEQLPPAENDVTEDKEIPNMDKDNPEEDNLDKADNMKNEDESGVSSAEEEPPAYMITDEDTEKENFDDEDDGKPVIEYNTATMSTIKDTTVLNGIDTTPPNTPSSVSEMAIFSSEFTDCSPYLVHSSSNPEKEKDHKRRKQCKNTCCVLLCLLALLIITAAAVYLILYLFGLMGDDIVIPIVSTTAKATIMASSATPIITTLSSASSGMITMISNDTSATTSTATQSNTALFTEVSTAPPQCQPYQFACTNGECVYAFEACNGVNDCGDSSDEHDKCGDTKNTTLPPPLLTYPPNAICKEYEFQCDSGECIYFFSECDGVIDCVDESDEDCTGCTNNDFECGNGTCIAASLVCDGTQNCIDASDEANCTIACPAADDVICASGACVSANRTCDGYPDCSLDAESEDEIGCTYDCVAYDTITEVPCNGFLPYTESLFPNFISKNITGYDSARNAELNLRQLYRSRLCDRKALAFMCGIIFPMCPVEGEANIAVCKGLCEQINTKTSCAEAFVNVNLNLTDICGSLPDVPLESSSDFCTFY